MCALCATCTFAGALPMARAAAQGSSTLRGRVLDGATRTPLADAEVRIAGDSGSRAVAYSTADGAWRLSVAPAPSYTLRIRHLGYAPRTVTVAASPGGDSSFTVTTLDAVPLSLDEIVVTASRRPERLANTPVPIELISRSDIERTGASDLASVLSEQIGIAPTAGHPSGAGVLLQGLGGERVLVLLDGRPLSGRNSDTFDLSRIPTSIIERVEVIKGPQSTLYGSDAMGGVINIITRTPSPESVRAKLTALAGSQGRRDISAQVDGELGAGVGVVASLGHRSVLIAPGVESPRGAYSRRWDGLGTVRWTPDSTLALEASALVVDEQQRWNEGLYYFAANRQIDGRVGAVWTPGPARIAPRLHVSEYRHLRQRSTLASAPPSDSGPEVQRLVDAEVLFSSPVGGQIIDGGVELRRDEIRSYEVLNQGRVNYSLEPFAQTTLRLGGLSVVPGVRMSWSDQWGTHWTPRLATLLRPTPKLAIRASVGYGFRTPDFKEMYMTWVNPIPGSSYAVHGNPDLRPERSRSVSASVEWADERFYGRAQAFDNHFRNFIESQIIGDSIPAGSGSSLDRFTIYSYGNIDRGRTRGVDLDAGLSLGGVRLDGGYSYLDAVWLTTGEPLLGRPTHFARLGVTAPLPFAIRASVTGLYTGRAPVARDDAGNTSYQSSYTRLDARLTRALPFDLDLIAGADNIFDSHPTQWPGVAERHVYMGLSWNLLHLNAQASAGRDD
jgi:outer membrane receptor for ferrienterochelin and colicins